MCDFVLAQPVKQQARTASADKTNNVCFINVSPINGGVAGVSPAGRGGEQRSANQGKAFPSSSLNKNLSLPPQQITLKFIKEQSNYYNHNTNHNQTCNCTCIISEVRILLNVKADSPACTNHFG